MSWPVWEWEGDREGAYFSLSVEKNGAEGEYYWINAHRSKTTPVPGGSLGETQTVCVFLPREALAEMVREVTRSLELAEQIRAELPAEEADRG